MLELDELELSLRDASTSLHVDELMKRYEKSIKRVADGMSSLDVARLNYIRNMAEYKKRCFVYQAHLSA